MSANGSSSSPWPTPDAQLFNDAEDPANWKARQDRQKARGINGNGMGMSIAMAAKTWPTPRASDGEKGGPNQSFSAGGQPLPSMASHWPTPTCQDSARSPSAEFTTPNITLNHAVIMAEWPTPSVAIATGGQTSRSGDRKGEQLLGGLVVALCSRLAPEISMDGETSSPSGRKLNPLFVEMLMGWPPGWISFACSATELSRFKRRMRSALSQLTSHAAPPAQLSLFG